MVKGYPDWDIVVFSQLDGELETECVREKLPFDGEEHPTEGGEKK